MKRLLGRVWSAAPKFGSRRIVLLYHAVGSGEWSVSERDFAQQMDVVAREAVPMPLVQALGTRAATPLEVALTFDDGYACVRDRAFPILNSRGLTATTFLNTSHIGAIDRSRSDPASGHYRDQDFMSWKDVDALLERGWTIGSHGARHLDLIQEGDDVVRHELRSSKQDIERVIPGPCLYFAYAKGRSTRRIRRLVAEAGYQWGLSTIHGAVNPSDDAFAVPRINIDARYAIDDFRALLRGDWDYLKFIQKVRGSVS
jgi:peptidoglycan/xylan/chitin deacetylase (PgdA/CDA1 family)